MAMPVPAEETDLSGHSMLGKLEPDHRYPFIAGIIDGLAYHRYVMGGKDKEAMDCVYEWFYHDKKAVPLIYASLGEFPDHPTAAVIAALINRKCGT
jgi:hypothetical protein